MLFKRKKRVKVKVYYYEGEGYISNASDGDRAVWNCYGSTKEAAKEMALYKLSKFQEETR